MDQAQYKQRQPNKFIEDQRNSCRNIGGVLSGLKPPWRFRADGDNNDNAQTPHSNSKRRWRTTARDTTPRRNEPQQAVGVSSPTSWWWCVVVMGKRLIRNKNVQIHEPQQVLNAGASGSDKEKKRDGV
jgi:hypothetical protein